MQLVDPRPSRPIPIRITPLIDVVFILLVFFMLTTRLLPVDHLELSNNTHDRSTATGDPLPELQVTEKGLIRWQDSHYALAELLPALRSAGVSEANLTTTPEARLADFALALSALEGAGIKPHWKRNASPEL